MPLKLTQTVCERGVIRQKRIIFDEKRSVGGNHFRDARYMRIAHGGGKGGDTRTGFLADGVTQYGENAADADGGAAP